MSKGSNRRPLKVPQKQVDDNWDRIFKKEKPKFTNHVPTYERHPENKNEKK